MNRQLELARRYIELGQPARALEALSGSGAAGLDDPETWGVRGAALQDLERYDEAVEAISHGLALDPEDFSLLSRLSAVQASRGDLASAERAALAALAQWPDHPPLLARYAGIVARAGQFEKADLLLDRAAALDPEEPAIAAGRHLLALLRDELPAAREQLGRMLEQNPDDVSLLAASGLQRVNSGDVSRGYRDLRGAATLDPRLASEFRASYEQARLLSHWMLLPLRPFHRFSPITIWVVAIGIIFGLRSLGMPRASGVFAVLYFAFCAYSWIAPPIMRRWLARSRA